MTDSSFEASRADDRAMGRLRVTAFCPECGEIRPVGDFGWRDISAGTLHVRCRLCRASAPEPAARCRCGTDDPGVLIPMDAEGRPVGCREKVDHHLCLRCLSVRVGGTV